MDPKEEIKALKNSEALKSKASKQSSGGCLRRLFGGVLLLAMAAIIMTALIDANQVEVIQPTSPTAIMSPLGQIALNSTPTLAPTATAMATATKQVEETAVSSGIVTVIDSSTSTPLPTYTPQATYTPYPTPTTPAPTYTPLPTHTTAPTYTPQATYTPYPAQIVQPTADYSGVVNNVVELRSTMRTITASLIAVAIGGAFILAALLMRPKAPSITVNNPPPVSLPQDRGTAAPPVVGYTERVTPALLRRKTTRSRQVRRVEPVEPVQPGVELVKIPDPVTLPFDSTQPPIAWQREYIRKRYAETGNKTAVCMECYGKKGGKVWKYVSEALEGKGDRPVAQRPRQMHHDRTRRVLQ